MTKSSRKVVCPFCLLGCELGIIVDDMGIKGVEYLKDSKLYQGRLCPRGNASALFLDSPDRLSYPMRDGRETTWEEAFKEIVKALKTKKKEEIALTFDCNLTEEEYSLIYELTENLGIENLASSYLEPEFYFNYSLPGVQKASLEDVKNAKVFLLVGDVFNQTPVISKDILDARYSDKNNRIFVIDSVNSHTAGFADIFVQVKPGGEPLALLAISKMASNKPDELSVDKITKAVGIDLSTIEEVANALNQIDKGVIISVMAWGKINDPILFSGASQYLVSVLKGDKKFLPLGESMSKPGKMEFGQILDKIKAGKIKTLINFGELFPFYYPQISSDFKKLRLLVATATLKPNLQDVLGLFLPATLNLEKSGEINTAFGNVKIEPTVEPMSGTKTVKEIIETISKELGIELKGKRPKFADRNIAINNLLARAKQLIESQSAMSEFLLVHGSYGSSTGSVGYEMLCMGEKPAYDFRSFFGKEEFIKINPNDAKKLGVAAGDFMAVQSKNGKHEFKVIISQRVPPKVTVVAVESPKVRTLFDMTIDKETSARIFPPTEVKL